MFVNPALSIQFNTFRLYNSTIYRKLLVPLLWPPYVIGGPLYFCPVISIYRLSIFFLA